MKRLRIPKLFLPLFVGAVILFGVIAVLTSLLSSIILRRVMLTEFTNRGLAIATSLADSSVGLVLSHEASTLQASIDQYVTSQADIAYVFVIDQNDRVVAHTFVPKVPDELLKIREGTKDKNLTRDISLPSRGEFLDITSPVLSGRAGYVHVGVDKSAITSQIRSVILFQSGLLLVLFLLSVFALSFQANRVSQPLVQLTQYTTEITADPVTLAAQPMKRELLSVAGQKDELGQLVSNFQHMIQQITEREHRVAESGRALATSAEVSRRLSTILDQGQLVKEVVEQLKAAFNYYHVHIYLFDEKREFLVIAGGTGETGRVLLEHGHKLAEGKGLVGRAAKTNAIVMVQDVSQEPDWLPNPLLPDTRSELAVPIAIGENVLGVVDVQQNRVEGLKAEDATLLQSIAAQVAIALQNARTYARTRRDAERETLLSMVGEKIRSTITVDDALKVAIRELGRAVGAPQTGVRLAADFTTIRQKKNPNGNEGE